jgi:hypothetical protein
MGPVMLNTVTYGGDVIPKWIGDRLGDLLLMQYDGDQLIISSAANID